MPQSKPRKSFTSAEHTFIQRRLVRAIRLALWWGAASSLPAAASCGLDGTTITGALVFTDNCVLVRSLDITGKGFLTNDGTITNQGAINSFGQIAGKGTLNNLGTLAVGDGGNVQITRSGNFANQTLTGGGWQVIGVTGQSSLGVGSGQIITNAADILLGGSGASFAQLSGLQNNQGSLSITQGKEFTAAMLHNTGTVTVASGARMTIGTSPNLASGTLTGGAWAVVAGGSKTSLAIGSEPITTNAATVLLSGATASFSQLSGMSSNTGSLTIAGGYNLASAQLTNTGTLAVESGATVNIAGSGNLLGTTLSKGRWEVRNNGALIVGSKAFTSNAADVLLSGANAQFAQFNGLTSNTGTLTIDGGHAYQIGDSKGSAIRLSNQSSGLLAVGAGGTLTVRSGSTLINEGEIRNAGRITIAGTFENHSLVTNTGTFEVQNASAAGFRLQAPTNLAGGTLTGGNWEIYGPSIRTVLDLGIDNSQTLLRTNAADIVVSGPFADFVGLAGLTHNQGALTIEDRQLLTFAQLENTGTLTVASGATVSVNKSTNFDGKTLTGGTWRVVADNSKVPSRLSIGTANIVTNAATVVLHGAGARFDQLNSLIRNEESLRLEGGRQLTLERLDNTGTVAVASGAVLTIGQSGNLDGSSLRGGVWDVDGTDGAGARLVVGSGLISTNHADIYLRGASAQFDSLGDSVSSSKFSLTTNTGILSVSEGASRSIASLANSGTLTVASGGGVTISNSSSRDKSTLKEGNWRVFGDAAAPSTLVVGSGAITSNAATVVLSGPGARFDQLTGLNSNSGSLTIDAGQRFTAGQLLNTGTLVVGADSAIVAAKSASFTQTGGHARINGLLDPLGSVTISAGFLSGSGTVRSTGQLTIGNAATVQPGNSPGTLTLDGNVAFSGHLDIEIASPTVFDVLQVTGQLDFKTGSDVRLSIGFVPTASSYSFAFVQAGQVLGGPPAYTVVGSTIGYSQELLCGTTSCSFNLSAIPTPVPEPAAYAMLLAGLGLVAYTVGRRRQMRPAQRAAQ